MKTLQGIVIGIAIGAVIGTATFTIAARSRGNNPPRTLTNSVVDDDPTPAPSVATPEAESAPTPTPPSDDTSSRPSKSAPKCTL